MQTEIKGGSAFSYVEIALDPGEALITESDAMSTMASEIDLSVSTNGGFFRALFKKVLGGETFFISRFSNNTAEQLNMTIVQPTPGEIRCIELEEEPFYLQPGAFLACTEGIKLGICWAGITSFIAREGLFRLVVSGQGKVWYGAYGSLLERYIDGEYIVDTSHLVAYEPGIKLSLQLAGGLFSSFFSGEGLVTRVTGKGKIILQSRSLSGLGSWLNPKF